MTCAKNGHTKIHPNLQCTWATSKGSYHADELSLQIANLLPFQLLKVKNSLKTLASSTIRKDPLNPRQAITEETTSGSHKHLSLDDQHRLIQSRSKECSLNHMIKIFTSKQV